MKVLYLEEDRRMEPMEAYSVCVQMWKDLAQRHGRRKTVMSVAAAKREWLDDRSLTCSYDCPLCEVYQCKSCPLGGNSQHCTHTYGYDDWMTGKEIRKFRDVIKKMVKT